jgi:hypothetical protein
MGISYHLHPKLERESRKKKKLPVQSKVVLSLSLIPNLSLALVIGTQCIQPRSGSSVLRETAQGGIPFTKRILCTPLSNTFVETISQNHRGLKDALPPGSTCFSFSVKPLPMFTKRHYREHLHLQFLFFVC